MAKGFRKEAIFELEFEALAKNLIVACDNLLSLGNCFKVFFS